MTRFFGLLLFALSMQVAANDSMGFRWHSLVDTTRPHWVDDTHRPMLINSFYPTQADAPPYLFGPPNQDLFIGGKLALNAPLNELQPASHPLVVLSHGNGSGIVQMSWLAEDLVAQGFIVIGVNHHGNTYVEPYLPQAFTHYWERPQDVLFAIDWAVNESPFKDFIDQSKIALVGYSLGGYTVLANAGGSTDRDYFINQFCQSPQKDATCEPSLEMPNLRDAYRQVKDDPKVIQSLEHQDNDFRSANIKAVVAISPPGHLFSPTSLSNIETPLLILVGENDEVTPAETNAKHLAKHIKQSRYQEIAAAKHYSMISRCTPLGKQIMSALCTESTQRARVEIHREVAKLTASFLQQQFDEATPSLAPNRVTTLH